MINLFQIWYIHIRIVLECIGSVKFIYIIIETFWHA